MLLFVGCALLQILCFVSIRHPLCQPPAVVELPLVIASSSGSCVLRLVGSALLRSATTAVAAATAATNCYCYYCCYCYCCYCYC
jgi:hypothetical protein